MAGFEFARGIEPGTSGREGRVLTSCAKPCSLNMKTCIIETVMLFVFYENTFSCVHERNQTSNEFHGFRQCRHPFSNYHSRYDLQTTIISCMPKNGKFLENLLCHVMNRRQGPSKCFLFANGTLKVFSI